ncbi:MAG: ribonuclease HII [Actinobacteria bacterium]|nr:ribonuclease HII [Actinomycetota bacterium]
MRVEGREGAQEVTSSRACPLSDSLTLSLSRSQSPHASNPPTRERLDPWFYENQAREQGCVRIVGVDEAGRGPLAGPVVAGAVILLEGFDCSGIRDSKAMTPADRDTAYDRIMAQAVAVGVGVIDPQAIDEINILRATHRAMRTALDDLSAVFDIILVDGMPVPDLPARSVAIVKGDSKSASIMCASIIAKVTRDRIMLDLDRIYPGYGFASHKGYSTKAHLEAIDRLGPCPCHRRSFFPISERIANCRLPGLE